MKKTALLFIASLSLTTASFGMTLHSMSKKQVTNAFVNNTVVTIPTANLNGQTIQNTVFVYLDNQGHIFGKMKSKPVNAPQTDQGTYVIKHNGTMCITWQHWDHAKTIHAHFFNTKNAYVAIDNNKVFHTAFLKAQIQHGNHL